MRLFGGAEAEEGSGKMMRRLLSFLLAALMATGLSIPVSGAPEEPVEPEGSVSTDSLALPGDEAETPDEPAEPEEDETAEVPAEPEASEEPEAPVEPEQSDPEEEPAEPAEDGEAAQDGEEPADSLQAGWVKKKGVWYYGDGKGGYLTGWQDLGGARYYLDATGAMRTGWQKLDGAWYWFKNSGAQVTGWQWVAGKWYYLDPTAAGAMATGWLDEGGARYYLEPDGAMHTGWLYQDGAWYCFNGSGAMVTGWYNDGRHLFYMDAEGKMLSGVQVLDGETYYLNESHDGTFGAAHTGWLYDGGDWYCFDSAGRQVFGWYSDGKRLFYMGADGKMLSGTQVLDGKTYYFSDSHDGTFGAVRTGWLQIGGTWYHADDTGAVETGLRYINGATYYLDPANGGAMLTGWQSVEGATRFFKSSGVMATGPQYWEGDMYLLDADGFLVTNEDRQLLGKTFHVDENGVIEGYLTATSAQAIEVLNKVGWNLRAAFNWSKSLPYSNRYLRATKGSIHSDFYANYGFTRKTGNCYVMASTFYQMARLLGYEVYFVEGHVGSRWSAIGADHGWTEIILDGQLYVFDPNFTNETGLNGYQIRYGQRGTWQYKNYARAD